VISRPDVLAVFRKKMSGFFAPGKCLGIVMTTGISPPRHACDEDDP
jgi:hypothetical protein